MIMKKHVINEHGLYLMKCLVHKCALEGRDNGKQYKCKKRTFVMPSTITSFFGSVKLYKKCHLVQIEFIEDLVLIMILKGYIPWSIMKSPWLKRTVICFCGQV
jgi:hypothetical protein